jgi:hypothetical protein
MLQSSTPVIIDLNNRLECYGCFNQNDKYCLMYCAVSINCAVDFNKCIDKHLNEEVLIVFK